MHKCSYMSNRSRREAEEQVFLWAAAIQERGRVICSGVLIEAQWVLTGK